MVNMAPTHNNSNDNDEELEEGEEVAEKDDDEDALATTEVAAAGMSFGRGSICCFLDLFVLVPTLAWSSTMLVSR